MKVLENVRQESALRRTTACLFYFISHFEHLLCYSVKIQLRRFSNDKELKKEITRVKFIKMFKPKDNTHSKAVDVAV